MTPKAKMTAVVLFVVVGFLGLVVGALLPQYLIQKMEEKRISLPQDITQPEEEGWEERSWTVVHMAKDRPGWIEVRRRVGGTIGDMQPSKPYDIQDEGETSILVPVPTEWRWQMPFPGQKVIVRTKTGETPVFVRPDHATRVSRFVATSYGLDGATVLDCVTDPMTGICHFKVSMKATGWVLWVGCKKTRPYYWINMSSELISWQSDWRGDGQQFWGYILVEVD